MLLMMLLWWMALRLPQQTHRLRAAGDGVDEIKAASTHSNIPRNEKLLIKKKKLPRPCLALAQVSCIRAVFVVMPSELHRNHVPSLRKPISPKDAKQLLTQDLRKTDAKKNSTKRTEPLGQATSTWTKISLRLSVAMSKHRLSMSSKSHPVKGLVCSPLKTSEKGHEYLQKNPSLH